MNSSSTPSALAYWREWARNTFRLQKPEPCVDFTPPAAIAGPPISPGPAAMAMDVAAAAFRNLRRDGTALPDRSMLRKSGRCLQPIRSHTMYLL